MAPIRVNALHLQGSDRVGKKKNSEIIFAASDEK